MHIHLLPLIAIKCCYLHRPYVIMVALQEEHGTNTAGNSSGRKKKSPNIKRSESFLQRTPIYILRLLGIYYIYIY